jgi:transposase InsO family protein
MFLENRSSNSQETRFSYPSQSETPTRWKRFQHRHVDSMWQGDTFQFRIRGVGKVYITGFTDVCSRYRVKNNVYLHKDAASSVNALRWALRAERIPREIYLDNGKQFVSKTFKTEAQKHKSN